MMTDRQLETLAAIENQLGGQDPALARALDTLTAPATVSRWRRCARWMFMICAVIAPPLMVAALAMIPLPLSPLAIALLTLTACIHLRDHHRRVARNRRLHAIAIAKHL